MATDFRGLPGSYVGQSITPRNIFTSGPRSGFEKFVPQTLIIDGTNSRDTGSSQVSLLRAGLILGQETSSKLLRNSIIGVTTASAASSATSVSVPASVATEVARLIANNSGSAVSLKLTGPPTAGGTVATLALTVSAASGTTLTCSALAAAAAAGSIVQPGDGSQTPLTVLSAEFGIDVNDRNGASINQPLVSGLLIGADLIAANIINLSVDDFGNAVDTSVTAWLKSQLQTNGRTFTFDSDRQ